MRTGAADHIVQADDGWTGKNLLRGMDLPTSIQNQDRLLNHDQADCPPDGAHIDGFEIEVEDQYIGHGIAV